MGGDTGTMVLTVWSLCPKESYLVVFLVLLFFVPRRPLGEGEGGGGEGEGGELYA